MYATTEKQLRSSNLELLRFLMTLFVITYHLIAQSDALGSGNELNFVFSCFFYAGGRMACVVFVMISAYFLVDQKFKFERILRLEFKTILIAVLVNLVVACISPATVAGMGTKDFISQFFPLLGRPYWYIQEYLFVLLASPFLNAILHSERLKKYRKAILAFLLVSIIISSIPPLYSNSLLSNDFVAFCAIYFRIGELKPILKVQNRRSAQFLSGLSFLLCYILMCCSAIYFNTIKEYCAYAWEIRFFYIKNYQTLLSIGAALSLFGFFLNTQIGNNKAINFLGRHSTGVYLLPQVPLLYYSGWLWLNVFHIDRLFNNTTLFPVYCVFVVAVVAAVSLLCDCAFTWCENVLFSWEPVRKICGKPKESEEY